MKNFVEAEVETQLFFEDGHQHVNCYGDPDLDFDSILRSAVKGLDPEMLFDPAEEQLHLPAGAMQLGNGESRKTKLVGEEDKSQVFLGIEVVDAMQRIRLAEGSLAKTKVAQGLFRLVQSPPASSQYPAQR